MKRIFDVIVSLIGIFLAIPLMIFAAAGIKLTSNGSILFKQQRVGIGGKLFNILKFRSMVETSDLAAPEITIGNDKRITPFGAFIRKWKIDELPQLFNVLFGDMSFVGPRPETPKYVALYPEEARVKILSVRPGITDTASIKYRDESSVLAKQLDPADYYASVILPDKIRIGVCYASNHTMIGDFKIIITTIKAVLFGNEE